VRNAFKSAINIQSQSLEVSNDKKCTGEYKQELPIGSFNKNKSKKDGYNTICRECSKENSRKYYADNTGKHKQATCERNKKHGQYIRQKLHEHKESNGCLLCRENFAGCLDFHHMKDKEHLISAMMTTRKSWESIEKEMSKCILLCSNCHRKVHAGALSIL